ncbi:MAG TPA: VCBS repeat-containing protein, partial [Polyangiaceae bacterium]|nr:VCBS repeat-containing protein [Polyangiaceae bacterium]
TSGSVNYVLTSEGQMVSGKGDFDGDGYGDIVAAAYGTATDPARLLVVRGGAGRGPAFDLDLEEIECRTMRWLSDPADWDGDGLSDWAVVCDGVTSGELRFGLLRGGSESDQPLSHVWSTTISLQSTSPALDFDGDGTMEFLLGVKEASPVIWRPGNSDESAPERFSRLFYGARMDVGDHNGDGRPDIVVGDGKEVSRVGSSTSFNVVATTLVVPTDATSLSLGF